MVANYVLLTFHISSTTIWRLGKHLVIIRPEEYNVNCPGVMSFHLVPHLLKSVAIVAKFFMCERKVSDLIYYFSVILFLFAFLFFINSQSEQHKMLRIYPLQPDGF